MEETKDEGDEEEEAEAVSGALCEYRHCSPKRQ